MAEHTTFRFIELPFGLPASPARTSEFACLVERNRGIQSLANGVHTTRAFLIRCHTNSLAAEYLDLSLYLASATLSAVISDETSSFREFKVYDDSRQPRDWNLLLKPSQCAVFFRRTGSQTPVSADGVPFANFRDSTFLLFQSLEAARGFCEDRVQQHPEIICEIFDDRGKANPPLLTIAHPRIARNDTLSPSTQKKMKTLAALLVVGAIPLFWWDWRTGGWLVMPTFLGFTMILVAVRLLWWNVGLGDGALDQQKRIEAHLEREKRRDLDSSKSA